jgi:hypothetical protein
MGLGPAVSGAVLRGRQREREMAVWAGLGWAGLDPPRSRSQQLQRRPRLGHRKDSDPPLRRPRRRRLSLDALLCRRRGGRRRPPAPPWNLLLLRALLLKRHLLAAASELGGDWLLQAQPLRMLLEAGQAQPLRGPALLVPWVLSWGLLALDLAVSGGAARAEGVVPLPPPSGCSAPCYSRGVEEGLCSHARGVHLLLCGLWGCPRPGC